MTVGITAVAGLATGPGLTVARAAGACTNISRCSHHVDPVTLTGYTLHDLGVFDGYQVGVMSSSINPDYVYRIVNGQVVGTTSSVPTSRATRFDWQSSRLRRDEMLHVLRNPTDLGTLGGSASFASGINEAGQVVGSSWLSGGGFHAFRTEPNAAIDPANDDLGTLGGNDSAALAVNDAGQAAGYSWLSDDVTEHAFRTEPDAPIDPANDDLGTLGGSFSSASGINRTGQVVGTSTLNGDEVQHAFRTEPNAPIDPAADDLGTLGGDNSSATAINDAGEVVGQSDMPDGTQHAFLYDNGGMHDLGTLGGSNSLAESINNSGQIVGWAEAPYGAVQHAFLYDRSGMHDLNDMISGVQGWELYDAMSIDDAGNIVGYAWVAKSRTMHGFVLTPNT